MARVNYIKCDICGRTIDENTFDSAIRFFAGIIHKGKIDICKSCLNKIDKVYEDIGNFTLDHTKDSPVKYNFIFDKPWNRSVQENNTKNFRVHGWDEIYELIDKLEDF